MRPTADHFRNTFRALILIGGLAMIGCGSSAAVTGDAGAPDSASDVVAVDTAAADTAPSVPELFFIDRQGAAIDAIPYGDRATVRVTGLEPHQPITIRSTLWGYAGWADFVADAQGVVDTATQSPTAGTYSGVDGDGLIWSMELQSQEQGTSFGVTFTVAYNGSTILERHLERHAINLNVVSRPVSAPGLVGTLFSPATPGMYPAVVVVGGSEGGSGSAEFRAAYLASLGVTAMGLAYFGTGSLPATLTEIPMEYFGTALDWLASQPEVDANRIAVMGGSRGGELALMLGARFPQIRLVIANVPSGLRWGGNGALGASAWTAKGAPLADMPTDPNAMWTTEQLPGGQTAYRSTPMFHASLAIATPQELADATIPVEQIQGPVLLIAGDDDGIWPSCTLAQIAYDRLTTTGHQAQHGDELLCLSDAGHHAGAIPGWPTGESYATWHPVGQYFLVSGGTSAGNGRAQRIVDDRIRALLSALAAP